MRVSETDPDSIALLGVNPQHTVATIIPSNNALYPESNGQLMKTEAELPALEVSSLVVIIPGSPIIRLASSPSLQITLIS